MKTVDAFTVVWFIGAENWTWITAVAGTWSVPLAGAVHTIVGGADGAGEDRYARVTPARDRTARSRRASSLQLRTAYEALGIGGFHHRSAVRAGDELFPCPNCGTMVKPTDAECFVCGGFHHRSAVRAGDELFPTFRSRILARSGCRSRLF